MRALAHPVRMALIELLSHTGTLTATQASDLLGESPANCAFHLRTLAKYGFVEEAGGGPGRVRPWRRVDTGIRFDAASDDPQAAAAAGMLGEFMTTALLERARDSLARQKSWPAQWQRALSQSESVSYMTTEEASALQADLLELLARHSDRVSHPERRPPGAMPIQILNIAYPLLHLSEIDTRPPVTAAPDADPDHGTDNDTDHAIEEQP